ncbi:MAG: inositol monophosphatase family protein [Bacteroidota bacterium]
MQNLKALCHDCLPLIDEVGDFIRTQIGQVATAQIETKDLNSLVSFVDKTAEEMLVAGLKKRTPDATFLTEEETVDQVKGDLRWIIDPLDGTTNFLHGVPLFAISVGLEIEGELVMGMIQEVNRKESFYAWKDGGAYLNGNPIHVSSADTLADSLLATGFPYYDFTRSEDYLKVLGQFMQKTRGIRRLGAAAIDLAFVACGRFEAFFEYGINTWDVAAGIVLVQEAGGEVTDFSKGNKFLTGEEIVATNGKITKELLSIAKTLGR